MFEKLLAVAALALGIVPIGQAGIIAQLDNPSPAGAPGNTLVFNVALTNTSATDQVWLNGIGSTASSPYLSIDTSPFDSNAPLFLDPMGSSGPFELFDVIIAPGTPDGAYVGSFVTIQGGPDGGTATAFDDLVDVSFDVTVQSTSTGAAPEPATLGMVGVALLGAGLAAKHGQRRSKS